MTYLEELQDEIRRVHGAETTHVESVPVTEIFEGRTVWKGIVEVFDLIDHPTAVRVYAWSHDTNYPTSSKRLVAVLQLPPIKTAHDAVKAAIIQDFRHSEPAE